VVHMTAQTVILRGKQTCAQLLSRPKFRKGALLSLYGGVGFFPLGCFGSGGLESFPFRSKGFGGRRKGFGEWRGCNESL